MGRQVCPRCSGPVTKHDCRVKLCGWYTCPACNLRINARGGYIELGPVRKPPPDPE